MDENFEEWPKLSLNIQIIIVLVQGEKEGIYAVKVLNSNTVICLSCGTGDP